jgi:hypothetical protein
MDSQGKLDGVPAAKARMEKRSDKLYTLIHHTLIRYMLIHYTLIHHTLTHYILIHVTLIHFTLMHFILTHYRSNKPTAAELKNLSAAVTKLWSLDYSRLTPDKDYEIDMQGYILSCCRCCTYSQITIDVVHTSVL